MLKACYEMLQLCVVWRIVPENVNDKSGRYSVINHFIFLKYQPSLSSVAAVAIIRIAALAWTKEPTIK